MNLLFAINGGYIPTFLGCMRSVLLHGGASHYEVFILHSDLTDGDEADIRTALPDVDFHFVFVDPAMFDGFPESKRYRAKSITASRRPCCCRTRSSASSISTRTRSSSTR